jgi:molecular chaperone GrpE
VTDRRRFVVDGEARQDDSEPGRPEPARAEPKVAGDPLPDQGQVDRVDKLTRAYAALVDDNRAFRQRLEREKDRVVAAERAKVAQALLDAHDELERAWNASRAAGVEESPALRDLREGVRLTLQGLASQVSALGAERLEVRGKPFDPVTAEAVDLVTVADPAQDGCVVDEVRPGWRLGDRLLRPARVRVGRMARA